MTRPILVDTDPGQDDAVALLLAAASPELGLCLVTAVAGNVPVMRGALNALRVLELADCPDVPVHAGADRPLLFPLETAEFVCGPDGLAGSGLPETTRPPAPGGGVEAILAALRAAGPEGLTLCALGPLTNVALALRLAPELVPRIREIVWMGGALGLGNMTPAAEFNAFVDPHAAAVVLGAGLRVTMFGLHVTHDAVLTPADLEAVGRLGTATGRAVHGMLTRPRAGGLGTSGHPLHDPCVIAFLLWPELFEGRDCFVEVETGAGPLRGRTTIDWNGRLKREPNVHVIGRLHAAPLTARLVERLGTLP